MHAGLQMIKSNLLEIETRLASEYQIRPWKLRSSAVDILISTILSQNTSDINSKRAFKSLKSSFSGWDEVALASIPEIRRSITPGGLANTKAGYIKSALKKIKSDQGRFSLQNLSEIDIRDSLKYLTAIKGVGEKTAACVLLFGFNKNIMPVDTHIHRITKRLGLVPNSYDRQKTFNFWFGQSVVLDYYNIHLNMVKHGRNVCVARKPKCDICVLCDLCAHFKDGDL
jgi:endonuclease III